MGQVIAVVSGKGGTGKTSFTAMTGAALAQLGKKTLVLDCDVGLRDLDIALGLTDRVLMDFSDVVSGRATLHDAAVRHHRLKNLYLLTAPLTTESALSTDAMRALLEDVREQFDFCLIDGGAGLGESFRLATSSADRIIVVSTTEPSCLRDAQRTVMELHDFPTGKLHLVVNRVYEANESKDVTEKLRKTAEKFLNMPVKCIGYIFEDKNVMMSVRRQQPFLQERNMIE